MGAPVDVGSVDATVEFDVGSTLESDTVRIDEGSSDPATAPRPTTTTSPVTA
jgi:hypothetical protein